MGCLFVLVEIVPFLAGKSLAASPRAIFRLTLTEWKVWQRDRKTQEATTTTRPKEEEATRSSQRKSKKLVLFSFHHSLDLFAFCLATSR